MKIILIRQADADMTWDARYDAASFERTVGKQRECAAVRVSVSRSDASSYRIYTGTGRTARETAELLFTFSEPPEATPLLDDVPLRAFRNTETPLPLWLWRAMAEVQWRVGDRRQGESKKDAERRVGQLADRIETEEQDCVIICGGLTMTALRSVLRRRGFLIEGGGMIAGPLSRVRATRRSLHCGGCSHNCLLSEAKCHIGKEKARNRGIG